MEAVFKVFLIIHIVCGSVGLLTGVLNVLRKKGDKYHKYVGKAFLISMLSAGISSLVLASIHQNHFLFMVGVFTLYMVSSGQLYLRRYNESSSKFLEWAITMSMLLAGILFVVLGILALIKSNFFGLVLLTFGCLGLVFVRQDFKNYKDKAKVNTYWLVAHLQRMTGGFIAALTAFLVVNESYFPDQIPSVFYWLLPTVVLTPLIVKWSRKYQGKKK
ncbi:MAG: DUF2306 domain-containing protein [Flavobacteriales bacterium]